MSPGMQDTIRCNGLGPRTGSDIVVLGCPEQFGERVDRRVVLV